MVSNTTFLSIVMGIAAGIAIGVGIGYAFATSSNLEEQIREQDLRIAALESEVQAANERNVALEKQQKTDMTAMMETMMQDPDLMKQMMNVMMQNPEAMQAMMSAMNQDAGNMSQMMAGNIQPFNPDAPITIPMIDGYYNGNKVFFVHTEVSDKQMADMMTMMINFPTLHVPQLANISDANIGKVYVFTNGVSGSGPYGGGPFMFQIDVFDSVPGQSDYSNFRTPYLVTWNDNATAKVLTSEEEILQAEANGELTIKNTGNVVNAPIIAWADENGQSQTASTIDRSFESMPGFSADVIHVDTDNYVTRLKLQQTADQQSNMTMMN